MKKIELNKLENITGGNIPWSAICFYSSGIAAVGVVSGQYWLSNLGAHIFYECVK